MSASAPKYKDYYELLGISRDGITPDKVKRAFMVKAMVWHPDKAPDEETKKLYTRVYEDLQQAYKVLSNDETRRVYSDTQQTANHELVRQERDLAYERSDKFLNKGKTGTLFDRDSFIAAFEQTRSTEDQKLIKLAEAKNNTVTNSEFERYLAAREREAEIVNVFSASDMSFSCNLFNQVFEYNKKNQPNRGLEEYHGEPVSAGLAELDMQYAGISMVGLNLSEKMSHDSLMYNPRNISSDMLTHEAPKADTAITQKEIDAGLKKIIEERERLMKLQASDFKVEQSEISKLYKELAEKKQQQKPEN